MFRQIILPKLGFILGFGITALILTHWLTAGHDNIIDAQQPTQQQLDEFYAPSPGTPQFVLDEHKEECWTMGQEPKAELPGAAIVQFIDGRTIYTEKHSLVDAAFNEALAAIGYGDVTSDKIDVIALCK